MSSSLFTNLGVSILTEVFASFSMKKSTLDIMSSGMLNTFHGPPIKKYVKNIYNDYIDVAEVKDITERINVDDISVISNDVLVLNKPSRIELYDQNGKLTGYDQRSYTEYDIFTLKQLFNNSGNIIGYNMTIPKENIVKYDILTLKEINVKFDFDKTNINFSYGLFNNIEINGPPATYLSEEYLGRPYTFSSQKDKEDLLYLIFDENYINENFNFEIASGRSYSRSDFTLKSKL